MKSNLATGGQPAFPPSVVVSIKAIACELPYEQGLPLSRFSISEIRREVLGRGLVASISDATLWRWLSQDAIRPWSYRSWIFPRDPAFEEKAGRILDLYAGQWQGKPLAAEECIISADEKTSIQARRRKQPTLPAGPNQPMRVEHEYFRMGAWTYLAAWDVRRAKIHGRCEQKMGIASFDRLVQQVMTQEPYRSAPRVFWILDNCSSHRGQRCQQRLQTRWPNILVVHTPVHASWLNQVEIYFSVLQRKTLTPNDFPSLEEVEQRLLAFEKHYEKAAKPFDWKFTRDDLARLLSRLNDRRKPRAAAA